MSWSVSANGTPAEVRGILSEQFKCPLAEKPTGLSDEGERKTVEMVRDTIEQALSTFDPNRKLSVSAYGHIIGVSGEPGTYQNVALNIG